MLGQSLQMMRARSLDEFRQALAMQQFPLMNIVYADHDGNILYLYNGLVPRRDPRSIGASRSMGPIPDRVARHARPRRLPQMLNPKCGYVQSCNSSPFTTYDEGNPHPEQFPAYPAEEPATTTGGRNVRGNSRPPPPIAFDRLRELAFDTTVYWAVETLPHYAKLMEKLKTDNPALAAELSPYLEHLLAWDCRVSADSTAATLCEGWYAELYGRGYPAETMRPRYAAIPNGNSVLWPKRPAS